MQAKDQFLGLVNQSFRFRVYLLAKLPAAFFSGIKIKYCSEERCTTTVPYKWLTQNPFHSTYFASLAMAAEMSTGVLVLSNTYKRKQAVSVLIIKMEANYLKKATEITFFTCEEGLKIENAVNEAAATLEGKTITVKSVGKNRDGELIAEFLFTWSFKSRCKVNPLKR